MIEKNGDVFTTEATFIAHGCNVDGVMGAGVAATVRSRYPSIYEAYKYVCDTGRFKVGDCYALMASDGKVILNLATQDRPGPHARYEWVAEALMEAASEAEGMMPEQDSILIAMPEIGCGIGGLDWEQVQILVESTESSFDAVEFEVWHYQP